MVMHFVPILHKGCRSKTNFYVFIYDQTSFKFCASFRIFIAVFIEKFQKIHYLSYVRRGIGTISGTISPGYDFSSNLLHERTNASFHPLTVFQDKQNKDFLKKEGNLHTAKIGRR